MLTNQLCTGCYLTHIQPCLSFGTPIIMPTYGAYVHLLDTWSIFPFLPASLLLPYPVFNRGNETFLFLSAFSHSLSLSLSLPPSLPPSLLLLLPHPLCLFLLLDRDIFTDTFETFDDGFCSSCSFLVPHGPQIESLLFTVAHREK